MPTPAPLTALSQLPARAVHNHFATRPRLVSVVFNALNSRLLERYPALKLDLTQVKLASPTVAGGFTLQLLLNVAIAHVYNPQLLDFAPRHGRSLFLTEKPPVPLSAEIDMQVIAQIIDEVRSTLYIDYQQAVADYWNALDSHGHSRWQWLGDFLQGQMVAAATAQAGLSDLQRDMLATVAAWPELDTRLPRSTPATYAYFIESTLLSAGKPLSLLTPDLLLVRDKHVLLCSLDGAYEGFTDIDAFSAAWGEKLKRQFQFDSLTWRRNEPYGNVFEQQAGLILNQQLEALASLSFAAQSEEALAARLDKLTDPALLLAKTPGAARAVLEKINTQLPDWLQRANADDRFAYHRHLQDMAQVLKKNRGRSFNEGIESIHGFSRDALRRQMQADHGDCDPDDVVLDFAVAAGYPGGAGIIQHVRLSLTELAVKNLAGKPKGTLTLSSKTADALPAWLTPDYLLGSTGLIQRVDIGSAYPQTLRDHLLTDSRDARNREQLFCRELKVRLPMQALEFKVRRQYGLTTTGYRYVKALMGEDPAHRWVEGQEIVLRPLGLCRKPHAAPDPVENFFIIEPRQANIGPHLLYRPLYPDCLYEYSSRQALLEAIATPGALHDSVLTWLTDKARPVYANGGIKEPHILQFLSGDDATRYDPPAPATLALDEGAAQWLQSQLNGQLLNHLFGSTARALVDLADRESVSNHESRWAILMEGAWLLFNTLLLPLLRGPAMLAGWLMILVSSLEQDLAGLDSTDATTRELALIDLLLNMAMVLLHATAPSNPRPAALDERAPDDLAARLDAWRRPASAPHPIEPVRVSQGSVALPGEPPLTGQTALDFSRSIASPKAAENLLAALLEVNVPWPERLPAAEASGPCKGLYRIGDHWHASLGGLLFQVAVVPGFGEVYLVHPQHPLRPGFKLTSDGQGHWRLDRGARLEGGMPRDRRTAWRLNHAERVQGLSAQLQALGEQFVQGDRDAAPIVIALNVASARLKQQKKTQRQIWVLLGKALPELREALSKRHQAEQQKTAMARAELDIAYANYRQAKEDFLPTVQRYQDKAEELLAIDKANPSYKRKTDITRGYLYQYWGTLYNFELHRFTDSFETERGESYAELNDRANAELQTGVTDAYQELLLLWKEQFEVFKQLHGLAEKMEGILREADPALRKSLLQDKTVPAVVPSVAIKQSLLIFLSELVLNHSHGSREPSEGPFVLTLSDPKRESIILSHAQLRDAGGYSTAEQMDVLKGVLELYEQLENAVNSLVEMGSGFIREDYRTPFLEHLSEARQSLETQLADLILVDEGFAPLQTPSAVTRGRRPGKVVFRTRTHQHLVGDLQPDEANSAGRFVRIQDPITQKVVATYHEHASEGFWEEVAPPSTPAPSSAPLIRSLEVIKDQAETVKARRGNIERTIRDQQKKLQDPTRRETVRPLEWAEMLTPQASQLEVLAEEVARDHGAQEQASALISAYRSEAQRLRERARQVCGEGFMQQRPRPANIAYLWRQGFVDINLVRSRVRLKTGDYLTEYAVRDKRLIKEGKAAEETVLWYAHFHYPKADTPALEPAYGHLKTRAERFFTRKELIEQARTSHRALVNLEKVVIKPPLDRELFLTLEPVPPKANP
ncbi:MULTISPECIES: hypothetical protein [Pseudomonas]|uniref:Dermonecrotic toxin N-terminal domain-containing protein n=1 Tax=Pseudomonas azadiae TaxID=2843612 RepID=A0ABS6P642_9PSED|nr:MULTISPECIES: hypothetical protein [Pseudomonas]MBV4455953.1 hypothetical protein [Pseudomonas azadiae]NMF42070.1 hypothetical protein [Pseudomonas sp. SWRI 103]